MTVLSFDLGKTSAFYVNGMGREFEITTLKALKEKVQNLVLSHKPSVILYPHPVRYYNVMRKHWQYVGIINYIAEKYNVQTIEVKDSQCKKEVMGNGKAKKEDIMAYFGEESEHIADCMMFDKYYKDMTK